jgi:energy-coupling factor transporter ATP-binding protein EcfA2
MSLDRISYIEHEGQPRHWQIDDTTFGRVNLIVGLNSAGKSRLLAVINNLARQLSGRQTGLLDGNFSVGLNLNDVPFSYDVTISGAKVTKEVVRANEQAKLQRGSDGKGRIYYEKESSWLEFQLAPDSLAALSRRDEVQHSFLVALHDWASKVVYLPFGTDIARQRVMALDRAMAAIEQRSAQPFEPLDVVSLYVAGYSRFGEAFDKAIMVDMLALDYELVDVGADDLTSLVPAEVPAAVALFTVEKGLGFKNPQFSMSQGMFRALTLCINLNWCKFSGSVSSLLIDDIGEGLDFARSNAAIELVISRARESGFQVIMTSNDRFVMNKVPLEYWSVLRREGGRVSVFNERNSPEQFREFKFLGLSNFDFLSSSAFEKNFE